jgi:SAM-dependent methyltransferase
MDRPETCRLCHTRPGRFEVVGDYVYGGRPEQKFYQCPNCDVAFLYPSSTEEEDARFYAGEFEKFMEDRSGGRAGWSGPQEHIRANQPQLARRMAVLNREVGESKLKILELGCSSGFMLFPLKERGMEVMGVEPSGGFLSFVRSRNIPVYTSLEEFKNQSGAAGDLDLVLHFFLFEHVREPFSFLQQCLEVLKPKGRMFFEVPSRDDPLITVYNVPAFHKFYWSVAHHWYFNRSSLEFVLGQLGCRYELIPEQRYDLSNHFWWALTGKPGGSGKFSSRFTPELEAAYKESMRRTGHCDTYFVWVYKD